MKTTVKPFFLLMSLKTLLMFFVVTLPVSAWAQFSYTTNNKAITITGYSGAGGSVTIPDSIDGLPVVAIGDEAFSSKQSITSVSIPDGVTSIGFSSFRSCYYLTNVALPDSITNIGVRAFFASGLTSVAVPKGEVGDLAFAFCQSLTNVSILQDVTSLGNASFAYSSNLVAASIGENVSMIGTESFAGCVSLLGIDVSPDNDFYTTVDGVLFNAERNTLVQYPGGRTNTFYEIADTVSSIDAHAFSLSRLFSITIPNSVTNLGGYAFYSCTNLTTATMGSGITSIGDSTFAFCKSLKSLLFAGDAPSPGFAAYFQVTGCTVYYLPGTTGWNATFAGFPTVLWNAHVPLSDETFGIGSGAFSFTIEGSPNIPVRVESSSTLSDPDWSSMALITLTNGSHHFTDPGSANHSRRFYRLRFP